MTQHEGAARENSLDHPWLLALLVLGISLVGGAFDESVQLLIVNGPFQWLHPITEAEVFASVWSTSLAIHAAVSAIAPVLGYTLLGAATSKTERLAPAGVVVSNAIAWKSYLTTSVSLLAGSLAAFVLAPSLVGLLFGLLVTLFVLARTSSVYAKGFDIVSDEETLHSEAMGYLKRQIRLNPLNKEASSIEDRRNKVNADILRLAPVERDAHCKHLFLDFDGIVGSLSKIDDLLVSRISAEATRCGVTVFRVRGQEIPLTIRRKQPILALQKSSVSFKSESAPTESLGLVDDDRVAVLQDALDAAIVFEQPPHLEPARKASYLVTRHIWALLLDAISRDDDKAFKYGTTSICELTDHLLDVCDSDDDLREVSGEWLTQIPNRIIGRLDNLPPEFLVEFARFVRRQLVVLGARGDFIREFRSYLWLLERLLVLASRKDRAVLQFALASAREIPVLCVSISIEAYRQLLKSIIEAFLDSSGPELSRNRISILETIASLVTHWAPKGISVKGIVAEVVVSLRATAMFLESQDAKFADLVVDAERFSHDMRRREFGAAEFMGLAAENVISEWDWEMWEVRQRDVEGVQSITIPQWIDRAIILELAERQWAVGRLAAPSLAVIERLQRAVQEMLASGDFDKTDALTGLNERLTDLHGSRSALVADRVLASDIDREKASKFVIDAVADIEGAYLRYGNVLLLGDAIVSSSSVEKSYGSSILVPKEWFVPDGVGDHSIHTIPPSNGTSMLRFEAGVLLDSLVAASLDVNERSLADAASFIATSYERPTSPVIVVGDENVLFDLEIAVDSIWGGRNNESVLFLPATTSGSLEKHVAVIVPKESELAVARTSPLRDSGEVFAERSTSPIGGSALVRLYAPTEAKIMEWREQDGVQDRDEWERRLRSSLVFSVAWNFEVATGQFAGEVFTIGPTSAAETESRRDG